MKLLFVDPQGNAQLLTPVLEQCQMKQPDVFKIAECTDEEFRLIEEEGALWIDGKPFLPPPPPEPTLEELKEQAMVRTKAYFKKLKRDIRDEREELELLDEDTSEKTLELKSVVKLEKATIEKILEAETKEELADVDTSNITRDRLY